MPGSVTESNEAYTMNIIAPIGADQVQDVESAKLNWPKNPTCRFSRNGGLHVLRKKGIVGADAQHIVVGLKCKCWHCPDCRVTKAKGWHARLTANLTTAFAEGRVPFVLSVQKAEWGAASRRFERADARWCAVETDYGRFAIGAALPGRLPTGATAVDAELAFALLDKYAVEVAGRQDFRKAEKDQPSQPNQPFTACRAWKAPNEKKEYEMVGRAPTRDPVELRTLLGNNNIPAKTIKTQDGWVIRFRATPDALADAFYRHEVNYLRTAATSPLNSGKSGWKCHGEESVEVQTGGDVAVFSACAFADQGPTRSPSSPPAVQEAPDVPWSSQRLL